MRNYIVDEYRDKKGDTLYIDEWKNYAPNDIPRQENGYDCGMFVCKFADFRSSDVPVRFSQTDLPYFRKRMLHEISSGYVI
jgi:sentrin-specific protease 1